MGQQLEGGALGGLIQRTRDDVPGDIWRSCHHPAHEFIQAIIVDRHPGRSKTAQRNEPVLLKFLGYRLIRHEAPAHSYSDGCAYVGIGVMKKAMPGVAWHFSS